LLADAASECWTTIKEGPKPLLYFIRLAQLLTQSQATACSSAIVERVLLGLFLSPGILDVLLFLLALAEFELGQGFGDQRRDVIGDASLSRV
jgi:hypothetical protein